MNSLSKAFLTKLKNDDPRGCCVYTGPAAGDGYGSICYKGKQDYAHRFSWILEHGPIPNNLFVLHRCDNRRCVNTDHLFLGTQKENVTDCVSKKRNKPYFAGGWCRGEMVYASKLNKGQVIEIRKLASTQSMRSLARQYGMDKKTISDIVKRKIWKHVPPPDANGQFEMVL